MRVYISSPLINRVVNRQIADALERQGFEVVLPERFCPTETTHESYPEHIVKMCLEGMRWCDIGLAILDGFGCDSAWELGWFERDGKPIVGFVRTDLHILRQWCLKFTLAGVMTDQPDLLPVLNADAILGRRQNRLLEHLDDLANALINYRNLSQLPLG